METLQYEIEQFGVGFVVGAWDEAMRAVVRLSMESYPAFEQAQAALFTGSWTLMG